LFENTIEANLLTVMTVTIKGTWVKTRPSDWCGIASADSSLVAVSFLRDPQRIQWCKSERGDPAGQEVRLLLRWYDKIGLDVQLNFGVGGARRSRTLLSNVSYQPSIPEESEFATGEPRCFATVRGEPDIDCWVLFLAKEDVSVGRKGLWHLRHDRREGIKEPLRSVLRLWAKGHGGNGLRRRCRQTSGARVRLKEE
jgi:hypothetical protein